MPDSRDQPDEFLESSDDDVYRLLPAEPPPPPDAAPARRRRRRKRRRSTDDDDPLPPVARPREPETDDLEEWVADTGWHDPPLISALWYPLTGSGWRLVPVYAAFLAMAIVPVVGSILAMFGAIFTSSLLLVTANYTLEGIPSGPQSPDLLSWDTIIAAMMGLVAFLISGVPTFIGLFVMSMLGGINPMAAVVLTAAGLFYAPMAFLALASEQHEGALNPRAVLRGIRSMLLPYVLLWAVAAVAFIAMLFAVYLTVPVALVPCIGFALVYTATALLRAVALVARKRDLTFD
ncbi:MAG: hypothetical protein ACE5KM_19380 [Planctomycetaceae bacterium]